MKGIDPNARYSINHEWVRKDGHIYTVGITDFGQSCLKEISAVELPRIGQYFEKNKAFAFIESVKSANEIQMPLSGTVMEINKNLTDHPELISKDCYEKGWLIKIVPSNLKEWQELSTAEKYLEEINVFFRKSN